MKALLLLLLCIASPAFAQTQASKPAPDLPEIDSAKIARRVVSALKPAAGEKAVIAYDPTYYPELTRKIEENLRAAGIASVTKYAFSDPEIANLPEAEVVMKLRPVFEPADIFLWLPGRRLNPDRRWERLLDRGRARGIHFHWISALDSRSAEEIHTLTKMYERAVLETNYTALSSEQDRLIAALRGKNIRITAPNGTDLRLRVASDAWFHKNDGDISAARARLSKALRDREMEFPSGALRLIPDVNSTQGRLVARDPASGQPMTLEFKRDRASGLPARWANLGGDIDKVGEIVIGTNPLLAPPAPLASGDLPYYGYGAGYVRVSLGDNWESGGANRVAGTINLWLFLENATLEIDGKALIRDGKRVK